MGVNNKQRRAAKQRKRKQRTAGGSSGARPNDASDAFGWADAAAAYEVVESRVLSSVQRLVRRKLDETHLLARVDSLLLTTQPQPRELVATVLADLLARLAQQVDQGGWGAADLEQLVIRNAGEQHLPTLRAVLDPAATVRLDTVEQLASGLAVASRLAGAPALEPGSGTGRGSGSTPPGGAEHPKLAQVRALLAKAESTEYDEEAEALTAKAQELISRYALDRLALSRAGGARGPSDGPTVRRIWLDAPYVRAKAALVDEVASANRCRAASADSLGFSVVVGAAADLEAVEMLVTSLLVQADTAMLREGRRVARSGRSRTRSFRQSFLMAYAIRIGERLRAATSEAVAGEGSGNLLPVLRNHEARVSAAFEAMVPHTVGRAANITDGEGWVAGQVAADLALLDVNGRLTDRAG